jgi:WS/DGAT/MGAT family acyltransferase
MAAKLQPMDPVDAAWYHMDGATNLAMVTGVALTHTPLDFVRTREVFAHRLLHLRRFRQRVVENGFPYPTPHWEDDPHFTVEDHFHHVALPEPCDKRALLDLLSDIASTPLDYKRPLWQVHIVDRVDAGSAMILRFHHCVGDGTALMAIAQLLFDTAPDAPLDRDPGVVRPPRAGLLDSLARPVKRLLDQSAQALSSGASLILHPDQAATLAADLAQLAARSAGVAVGTLLKTPDPQSPLKGALGIPKRVAWSEPVDLETVKRVGQATGAKVNDVLVAAMAGALRHYMQARGAEVDGMTIRGVVPVDLRRPDRALDLGNRFGLVFLDLPVGISGPLERLAATRQRMDAIKHSPEAAVFLGILGIFGRTPRPVEDIALTIFGSKATLVITNVAGPRTPLFLAGSPIARTTFWVPHPADLGMGISILSYNGAVTLGIVADAGLVPDPEHITAEFNREFDRLCAEVNAAPSATPITAVGHCAATTAAGRSCKNKPLAGSAYCRVHQPK